MTENFRETLVYEGSGVKALGGGKVGGYLVRFSGPRDPDLYGDFFTAKSDLDVEDGDTTTVYYQHGFDSVLKNRKLGKAVLKFDDFGLWAEAQLDIRDEYEQLLYEMAEAGKMGWSSGAVAHLVQFETVGKAQWIKSWPVGEASLTPNPAEPRNSATPIKAWAKQFDTPDGQAVIPANENDGDDLDSIVKAIVSDELDARAGEARAEVQEQQAYARAVKRAVVKARAILTLTRKMK